MRAFIAVLLIAFMVCGFVAPAAAQDNGNIRLTFSQTDVAQVLKAIGLRTGANIVYAGGKDAIPITINVAADTPEDAIRAVTSAAGLIYRRTGKTFVVAKPEAMKQALAPFAYNVRFTPGKAEPAELLKLLQDALPLADVRLVGTRVSVTAVPEDIASARDLIRDYQERLELAKPTTAIITLKNANADKVATLISSMFPKVKAFASTAEGTTGGAVALSGPEGDVAAARATIEELDLQNAGRGMDYRVYNIKYSTGPILKKLLEEAVPNLKVTVGPEHYSPPQPQFHPLTPANLSASGGSTSGGTGTTTQSTGGTGTTGGGSGAGGTQPFQRAEIGDRSKVLLVSGPSDQIDTAFRLLEQMDLAPAQVSVEVRVVDTSPESSSQLGFDYNWTRLGFFEVPPGTNITGTPGAEFNDFVTKPSGFGQFSRVPWNVDAFLRALTTRREAKILANPSIQVVDNDDANIFIGDTIRARVASASALGGQTIQIVEFPIGIVLLLRPRVNADGNITLRVHPVVSTITSLDANGIPQTSSREAETTVMVKDGETVVIGGLIRDEYSKTVREIPLLSKLPIIGELFKDRSTSRRKSDILVFITPRIVRGEAASVPAKDEKKAGGGQ